MFSEGPLLWPHKNSFRAFLHVVSLSRSLMLSLPLSLCSLFSPSLSWNARCCSLCTLSGKKWCVNCCQVMSNATFVIFCTSIHFLRCKQADSSEEHLEWSYSTLMYTAHTHTHIPTGTHARKHAHALHAPANSTSPPLGHRALSSF